MLKLKKKKKKKFLFGFSKNDISAKRFMFKLITLGLVLERLSKRMFA